MFTAAAVRRNGARLAFVVLVALGGSSAAAHGAAVVRESCDSPYLGERTPGPEPERTPRLILQQGPDRLVFGQDRRVRTTTIRFVTDSDFFADPARPIAARVELSRDNVDYASAVAAATSADRGIVEVVLCIDPRTARLPAGEYEGAVTLDDDRLPLTSVPFEASLQFQFAPNWMRWLLFAMGMVAVGAAASFGAAYRAAVARGVSPPPFVTLFRQNPIVFAFGIAALVPTWWSSYWRDASWPGDANAFLTLGFASAATVAAAMSAVTVYRGSVAPAVAAMSTETVHRSPIAAVYGGLAVRPAPADEPVPWPEAPRRRRLRDAAASVPRHHRLLVGALTALGAIGAVVSVALTGPESGLRPALMALPAVRPATPVAVPDVVGVRAETGLRQLRDAGFRIVAFDVCSSSMRTAGLIRQVLVQDDGSVVVDRDGVTARGSRLPTGTLLEVKVTNGRACAS